MKERIFKIFMIMSLAIVSLVGISSEQVDAASSNGYDYVNGSCRVKVWTDYYRYTSKASTVDAWATNSGCGKLYYKMKIVDQWGHSASSQSFSGYFSSQTPVKSFDIDLIRDYDDPLGDSDAYMVEIYLYADSAYTKYLGLANTNIIVEK